jgi:signal transduction histidine kinase
VTLPGSPPPLTRRKRPIGVVRLAAAGAAIVALWLAAAAVMELTRFGRTDAAAMQRAEAEVRESVLAIAAETQTVARATADAAAMPRADREDQQAIRALFDTATRGRTLAEHPDAVAITIYDARGTVVAWTGRASDLPLDRIRGPVALFVTRSPLGLRLVCVQPIGAAADETRIGSVAAEHAIGAAVPGNTIAGAAEPAIYTSAGRVLIRPPGTAAPASPDSRSFTVAAADGTPLIDATLSTADVASARHAWRRIVAMVGLATSALIVLLMAGPLLDRRAVARQPGAELRLTVAVVLLTLAAAVLFWIGRSVAASPEWRTPMALLLGGAAGAACVAAAVSNVVRLRVGARQRRRAVEAHALQFVLSQLAAGAAVTAGLVAIELVLGRAEDASSVNLRHFALQPWGGPRLASIAGLLLAHAAVLWACALACALALAFWRLPRRASRWQVVAVLSWVAPVAIAASIAPARGWRLPGAAVVPAAVVIAVAALMSLRLTVWYRHTTVVSRILALFMAFLLPALLIYPSVTFFVDRSMRRLIATQYAVETVDHPGRLLARLNEALAEIDRQQLPQNLNGTRTTAPSTDPAFSIWNHTVLATARLTSDVELFDRDGDLVSRFALNFPEYTGAASRPQGILECRWDEFSEVQPFGAEERRLLHAQRSICDPAGHIVGAIIVHVVFDYETLPFITSQSPYYEALRGPADAASIDAGPAGDVEVVVYGWSRRPIYTSGGSAWPLDEATFERIYRSRQPFWTRLEKEGNDYNVYISNDRASIYALGYPIPGIFEHLVSLAELTTLAAAGYALILIGAAVFARLARGGPPTGRALLREIRASFYRKLFLAFVLASIVPVLTLALVIRTYFANLLYDGIEAEAARTAAVAERVIGESDALLRRGGDAIAPFDDDVMVWISQVINQDVNIFDGPELLATSERDLFASGLLPTRAPEDVYRAIVLQRLPSFVSEDRLGNVPYMVASTPVRAGSHDGILTVPLALRQREVNREIDELDRGVDLAALFFILLGAAIGLSMAERIADPVRRLTRATGRIAGGDFDARIAVRSSDELRRLVDAFNSMAGELKAQRTQLERTHRLEAWAEMARQVAHEIKNPLTPIQLSAEHLRRVHADRGEPLSPVLEGCVDAILGQVHLLRQIAAEFSSFASAPTARPAPTDPVALVHDVVEPYRAGLEGRIEIVNNVKAPLPRVLVDRTLVSRALANLVENALHAMPGTGRLELHAGSDGGVVRIRVADTGVGMDADALDRAFEPYFSTKTTGTGLGLPIARRNIELSGGTIAVESEKGRGTVVTLTLPVAA